MSVFFKRLRSLAAVFAFCALVQACESYEPGEVDSPTKSQDGLDVVAGAADRKTIFGEGGLLFFGEDEETGNDVGVNSFLWRASLDTISFMPVNSADIFGGVIITDWHANAEAPNERFKLNVYILGRTLRADGIRVAVFRQVINRNGQWQDASVPEETKVKIEDAILTRARQMRNDALVQQKK